MKVCFLIDGFNIYHSILELQRKNGRSTKWLDLKSLCLSYLYLFGKEATLESIYYFSAIPYYLKPRYSNKIKRHKIYISCLSESGIKVILGRFKAKNVFCENCKKLILKHEEKETDVSIAITLMEIFMQGKCDLAVIISGDTDLSPVVKKCQILFPEKKVIFANLLHEKTKNWQN